MVNNNRSSRVMIIAGSDSGGGAGLQGDMKSCMAMGTYSSTIVTAVTAQNTLGVQAIHEVPVAIIEQQIHAVLGDIGADIIKVGMLSSTPIVETVVDALKPELYGNIPMVIDPVMVAKGGARLLEQRAVDTVITRLIPKAYLLTPNIPEAEILSGQAIQNQEDMIKAAFILMGQGADNILIKGGHLEVEKNEELVDILVQSSGEISCFTHPNISTNNTHGTGCSLASAISALLAKHLSLQEAVRKACQFVHQAITHAPKDIGHGHGPIGHGVVGFS